MGKPSEKLAVREPGRQRKYTWAECELVATTHGMDEYHRDCLMWALCRVRELELESGVGVRGELSEMRARLEDVWREVSRHGKAREAEVKRADGEDTHGGVGGGVPVVAGAGACAGDEASGDDGEGVCKYGDGPREGGAGGSEF